MPQIACPRCGFTLKADKGDKTIKCSNCHYILTDYDHDNIDKYIMDSIDRILNGESARHIIASY